MQTEFHTVVTDIALSYEGMEEVGNNAGWRNKAFEAAMKAIGWFAGWAWCASFVRLVYLEAARKVFGQNSPEYAELKKVLSHSVIRTYENIKKSGMFSIRHNYACPGDIILWSYGGGKGHTGIIISASFQTAVVMEGNTNKAGQREGKWAMRKDRYLVSAPDKKLLGIATFRGGGG